MKSRPLGNSGIAVAPLALGGNVFGWTIDRATSFAVLDAFVDLGFDLIDTANIYSTWVPGHQGGESESIIGDWLASTGKRHQIILATKVGMEMGDGSKGLRKASILQSVEDSLRRLRTDHIDLYQSHQDDPHTPLDETLSAYDQLIREGKVRAIGASNYSASRLQEALDLSRSTGLPAYASLQPEYNLYDRAGFEETLEPLCLQQNIGVIGYYSLASGFLTGKYRTSADLSKSARGSGVGERYLNERGLRILAALDDVAKAHATSPAVISLAWLMQRPSVTAPIASATHVDQLTEIAHAASLNLSEDQVALLDQASAS
ncbi:aryl-alcohol dehydrogenase-like predicted oxidoreductase [Haloferula luteola]|uniref:Aryl-alcohol dehydrogenase-like predicted oxidoreductase n=1 Tax=Haloferula luteola TaxID=595692 RepID=A0A840UWX9_9BACT|nr:aldo/keto reductase [Haloferula luteola]MBB5350235.1 aryl-alcohol dehydrogenase-like predicted oxidoreductase [Haloferula luteola]